MDAQDACQLDVGRMQESIERRRHICVGHEYSG